MADTVKKSRIVSEPECLATFEEDTSLQDIINEEFTQRLKTCMQDDNFIEPNEEHIALTYESGEVVLKNGDLKKQTQQEQNQQQQNQQPVLDETVDLKEITTDLDFPTVLTEPIKEEIKETKSSISLKDSPTKVKEINGSVTPNIQEDIPQHQDLKNSPSNGIFHSNHSEESIQQISPEDSFVNKEIPSPEEEIESPFDNVTVTDVDNENLTAKERFLSTVKDIEDDNKQTIKDRMFLSTDSACLLFTQTVVQSPMLTPTDENYDFLQGLKLTSSDTVEISSVKNEEILKTENIEQEIDEISEISAENEVCVQLESSNSEDNSESLKNETENEENIKNITSKFFVNEVTVTDGEITSVKTYVNSTRPIFKSTPTIVEHLVDDIDPDNDEIIEDYSITHEDTQTISNEAIDMNIANDVHRTSEENICGYEENVSCELAKEEINQNEPKNEEISAENYEQNITFDGNMSSGDQIEELLNFEVKNDESNEKNDESSVKNDESTVKNDESTVKNDESTLKNDDSLLKNNESIVKNSESAEKNVESIVKNEESIVKNDKSALNNDESNVNNDESTVNNDESNVNNDESTVKSDESIVKSDESIVKSDESTLKSDESIVKSDVSIVKSEEFTVKSDESIVKSHVSIVKSDVSIVKSDESTVKSDESIVKSDVSIVQSDESILKNHESSLKDNESSLNIDESSKQVDSTSKVNKSPQSDVSSPTKVSEISKIFAAKDPEDLKEELMSPKSPVLDETFEDIKKTKEIFEKMSSEETILKSCDLIKRLSDSSPGSESECATNIVCSNVSTTMTSESSFVETRTEVNSSQDKVLKKKKSKKSKKDNEKENISVCDTNSNDDDNLSHVSVKNLCRSFSDLSSLGNKTLENKITKNRTVYGKSSFSKFDALQKKSVLHVRSSDSGKAQEKFNGNGQIDTSACKSCNKQVFQMEQIKAEKAIWHKNCFRCQECNKQLNVDTYQSNEGVLYCKPHFKALFTPKAVEDEPQPTSDKPDLGLEELQNLNVKERFQVFEHHENQENCLERTPSTVNVKRSPSILSKLAKFQSKGMDIGVADDSLNGVPVEESSSEEEEEEEEIEGEDAELVRARRAQREKPMHFSNMSDVMSKWESGNQMSKEERREERKQEIQSIRSRLFMGKQAKIKEMYQQAVADSSSGLHIRKTIPLDTELTESARSLRERFERGEQLTSAEQQTLTELDDAEVFESGISKKSRSIFLELDANASKPPSLQPAVSVGKAEVKRAREVFMSRQASEDVVKASDQVDAVQVKTADISSRFKFFETYKEPEKHRKEFRITPPRDGQTKVPDTPEDTPLPVAEPDDTTEASSSHTATRMLNVFRQMEESAGKEQLPAGPKPLKRFTPPPEPQRPESDSEEEYSEEEEDDEEVEEQRVVDEDLLEAQKAARAKQLRAKFEKWEANEIKREQNNSSVNIAEEMADADSQIESAKSLCARFESMRETNSDKERTPRVKVNRFVDTTNNVEMCKSCEGRVYPLEKVSCHNNVYHKNCFRCRECNTILRMDSYTYNQGLLYCLPHFKRLFISKGNYEAGFGLDQHKEKWNAVA